MFILMTLLNHKSIEKYVGKKDLVSFLGPSDFEIVFALLAKAIVVKVYIYIIKVGKPSLEKPLLRYYSF